MFALCSKRQIHQYFTPQRTVIRKNIARFSVLSRHSRSTISLTKRPQRILPDASNTNTDLSFSSHARKRLNSTSASTAASAITTPQILENGLNIDIDEDHAAQFAARAKEVWPCPPIIPPGWSCAWDQWPYLMTFFWDSPYYLMLPQIEMMLNIQHRIPGEARPLLFSPALESFIFTLVQEPSRFFFFDCVTRDLYALPGVTTERALVEALVEAEGSVGLRKELVPKDKEGEAVLERILKRDATVIPVLAENFLDYKPEATHPFEENPDAVEDIDEEMVMGEVKRLLRDIEADLGPLPELDTETQAKVNEVERIVRMLEDDGEDDSEEAQETEEDEDEEQDEDEDEDEEDEDDEEVEEDGDDDLNPKEDKLLEDVFEGIPVEAFKDDPDRLMELVQRKLKK